MNLSLALWLKWNILRSILVTAKYKAIRLIFFNDWFNIYLSLSILGRVSATVRRATAQVFNSPSPSPLLHER